jgi:hypothetical protein
VLTIVAGEDALLTSTDFAAIERASTVSPNHEFWLVPNAEHLLSMQSDPAEYARRIEIFLHRCTGQDG